MIEKIGNVKCSRCGREWVAACESVETEAVECPDCGFMQPVNCAPESAPREIVETNATSTNTAMGQLLWEVQEMCRNGISTSQRQFDIYNKIEKSGLAQQPHS